MARAAQIPCQNGFMKIYLAIALVLGVAATTLMSDDRPAQFVPPISDPADPSYVVVPDVPGLPRVLFIGDSISMGYMLPVRAMLKGRANVHRPADNCGQTAYGLMHLDEWLGSGHWDVIHFNFGLHDLKYVDAKGTYVTPDKGRRIATPTMYGKNLEELIARLRGTGARLIFATTTPVPTGAEGRVVGSERVYNAVALRVMKENGIAVDDLWSYAAPRQARIQKKNDVHFTPQGYRELAGLVSKSILAALPPQPR